ncbi:MAG: VWA domain-containing protein [Planctomycetota bacterium]
MASNSSYGDPQRPATSPDRPPVSSAIGPYVPEVPKGSRIFPAWALSLLLHSTIFVVLLIAISQVPDGAGEVENRTGGIVLVDLKSKTTEYLSDGDVESAANPQSAAPPNASSLPDLELPPELPGPASSNQLNEAVVQSIANGIDGASNMIMTQPRGKIGGEVTTEVFGVTGTGNRFVYVVDRSDSMSGFESRPILAARQQLVESLESLQPTNQFQIIFYNGTTKVFNPDGQPTMYFADEEMKQKAIRFVNSTPPDGGTNHVKALAEAFRLHPDVIFLLTDAEGGFTKAELNELSRLNRSAAVINAIEFGEQRGTDQSLAKLARESGGHYIFKNINTLRVDE